MLSPWMAADEARVSHVLPHVVWWKKKNVMKNCCATRNKKIILEKVLKLHFKNKKKQGWILDRTLFDINLKNIRKKCCFWMLR